MTSSYTDDGRSARVSSTLVRDGRRHVDCVR